MKGSLQYDNIILTFLNNISHLLFNPKATNNRRELYLSIHLISQFSEFDDE